MSNIYVDKMDEIIAMMRSAGGSGEADAAIVRGQPVYVVTNGHIDLARADAMPQAGYAGLATADAAATFAVTYASGPLSLPDWTAIAGSQYLTPGAIYYLDPVISGQITTIAPASGYLVVVGRALGVSQLHAYQEPIILL